MVTSHWKLQVALTVGCSLLIAAGCSTPPSSTEGFAIYLTRNNVPPSEMEALSHVDIADEPFISMEEVLSYDASTHELTLTSAAYQRLASLNVPVSGTAFVACVDGGPVYRGAFWTPVSSLSFDGVTIWQPLGVDGSTAVQIRIGYPGTLTEDAEDPRNGPAVLEAFQRAGKLIVRPPTIPSGTLPQAFKGYELYSWKEGQEWHFTLVSGTNRNKTAEEVLSHDPLLMSEGWVHVHASGVEELRSALSMLPSGQDVFWFAEFHGDGGTEITLPPQTVIEYVAQHAAQCGLNMSIVQH